MYKVKTFLTAVALVAAVGVRAQSTLTIDAASKGASISPTLYGIFFEEINHAGDGGIYAELIRNRSFEDDLPTKSLYPRRRNPNVPGRSLLPNRGITGWHTVGEARAATATEHLLNEAQGACLRLDVKAVGAGIRNEGFWGINAVKDTKYHLSFWLRADEEWAGTLTAALCSDDGKSLGSATVSITAKDEWARFEADIIATGSDPKAGLALTADKPGILYFDMVSLFPPTYKNRPNGCRKDLAELLEALHPKFMRFPGGCYVEGQTTESNDLQNRFVWYNTIGPVEQRPGHLSVNWGYNISDGLGYHEMLQLSEDLGATPLFVVNVGIGHGWLQPYNQIEEYIQEALNALEYANGPVTSKWGKLRAENGHPEPFNLRLLEVGNENANFYFDSNRDQSDHYFERYEQFYKAIKAKYPDVQVIGNVESWGTDNPSWRSQLPVDLLDEHYYRSPSWFAARYNKYDSYDRRGPKIYVGEYAVTSDFGTNGHLTAGLGEAIYMLGMERNADVVTMASQREQSGLASRHDSLQFRAQFRHALLLGAEPHGQSRGNAERSVLHHEQRAARPHRSSVRPIYLGNSRLVFRLQGHELGQRQAHRAWLGLVVARRVEPSEGRLGRDAYRHFPEQSARGRSYLPERLAPARQLRHRPHLGPYGGCRGCHRGVRLRGRGQLSLVEYRRVGQLATCRGEDQ